MNPIGLRLACLLLTFAVLPGLSARDSLWVDSVITRTDALGPQDPAAAKSMLEQCYEACIATGYREGQQRVLLNLSNWEGDYGSHQRSLELLQALELETRANPDHSLRGAILHNIGRYYQERGIYSLALKHYLLAKDFFTRNHRAKGMAVIYGKLAFIYKTQGRLKEAEEDYTRAAKTFSELGNWPEYINTLHNLGFLYEDLGRYAEAESLFIQVRDLATTHAYAQGIYIGQFALATHLMDQQRYSEAEAALLALEDSPFVRLKFDRRAAYLLRFGSLHLKQGQYPAAIRRCQDGMALANQLQSLELKKSACECLAYAHEALGDYRAALRYTQDFHDYRDSLQDAEAQAMLADVRAQYDLEKVEKDLAQSELARAQEKNLRLEAEQVALNQKRVRVFVLVLLGLAVGFLVWFVHTNRRIQRKNRLIQAALSEKEVLLGEVHHRVKNNLQLISSIIDLQARSTGHAPTEQLLGELRNRVHAITLLHQQLYQQPELHAVRTREYLPAILENLRQTLSPQDREIALRYEIDAFSLPVGTAITLGLIVSELITNAYRHGFPAGRSGQVRLSLAQVGGGAVLRVEDDGQGMQGGQENFGMHMIRSLVRQMKASIHIHAIAGTQTEIQWTNRT